MQKPRRNQSRVQFLNPHDLTEEHLSAWRLFQSCSPALASPYLTPEFPLLVSEVCSNVVVAVFEENGRIAGFFPFERHGRIGKPVGGALSDCQAVIAAPWWNWNPIELVRDMGLSAYDFTHHRAEQAPLKPFQRVLEHSHMINLTGGFEAYLKECRDRGYQMSGASSGLPHQTIVRKRRLERQFGPIHFEMHDSNPHSLRQLVTWKSFQYNRAGIADAFARAWTVGLLERIHATRTGTFAGVLSTLSVGNKILAAHMGMRSATVLHWWFPAYDLNYAKFSPGLILLLELCRSAEASGIRTIELGPGDEPYKALVANSQMGVTAGFIGTPSLADLYRRFLHGSLDIITRLAIGPIASWPGRVIGRVEKASRYDDFNTSLFVLAKKANAITRGRQQTANPF